MRKHTIRLSTFITVALSVVAGGALFWVSQQVQLLEHEQRQLKQEITGQKEGIRVLDAEWDYLNRPERLEELVGLHLRSMTPLVPENLLRDASAVPEPVLANEDERTFLVSTPQEIKVKNVKVKSLAVPDSRPIADDQKKEEKNFNQIIDEVTGADE